MKKLVIANEASEEFEDSAAFIESARTGSGERFKSAIGDALDRISVMPSAYSPYLRVYRKCVIRKFQHVIYFREFNDHIWITAITHGKRKPKHWIHRKHNP